jgi:Asp-tRNA(Asn)/Glu-tRNA(Gln) amidotransferase A subunit family amidase
MRWDPTEKRFRQIGRERQVGAEGIKRVKILFFIQSASRIARAGAGQSYNAYISVAPDIRAQYEQIVAKARAGTAGPLAGYRIGIKDNICQTGGDHCGRGF